MGMKTMLSIKKRSQKIINNQLPSANQNRLVIGSNSAGNGFLLDQQAVQLFQADEKIKQVVRNLHNEMNKVNMEVWIKNKEISSDSPFEKHLLAIKILILIVFISALINFLVPTTSKMFILGSFCVLCTYLYIKVIITVIILVLAHCKQFVDFHYQTDLIKNLSLLVHQYSMKYLAGQGYVVTCDQQITWVCIKKKRISKRLATQNSF